jgi:hypothetical protein
VTLVIIQVCCTDSIKRIIKGELHSFTLSFDAFYSYTYDRIKLENNSKFIESPPYKMRKQEYSKYCEFFLVKILQHQQDQN